MHCIYIWTFVIRWIILHTHFLRLFLYHISWWHLH
jgi:hypothetical protein